jgi:hypothetical protein
MTSPYTPEFDFTDWPNGPLNANLPPDPLSPNAVLTQVEAEFQTLATVIAQLSARIDELTPPPPQPPQPVLLNLTPAFGPVNDFAPWVNNFGIARKPEGEVLVVGLLPVQFPDGAVVTGFRAKGTKAAGNLSITLQRGAAVPNDATAIARIPGPPTGAFDLADQFISTSPFTTIDNEHYRYWIVAGLTNGTATGVVEIHGLRVTYTVQ